METAEVPQIAQPKTTNWPKIILAAVLGFSLLTAAAYAGYWYGTESSKLESQTQKEGRPFPLNDTAAVYHINRSGQRFTLSYTKNEQTQVIYIGKSSVGLEPYVGKEVLVEGEFRTEEEIIQCFRAPCPPAKVTVLDTFAVQAKP